MALRLGGSAAYAATTGLTPGAGMASTTLLWLSVDSVSPAFQCIAFMGNTLGQAGYFEVASSSLSFSGIGATGGTATVSTAGGQITAGAWHRAALVQTLDTTTLLLGAATGALQVRTGAALWPELPTSMRIGEAGANGGSERLTGRMAGLKVYSVALTVDEVEAELATISPQRTDGLLRWHPWTTAEVTDYSGLGNDLTTVGTPTTVDGPPVRWARSRGPRVTLVTPQTTTHPAAATLAGGGDLSGSARQGVASAAVLAGAGDLSVAGRAGYRAAASLGGGGDLTASATRVQAASATLTGAGGLTAGAARVQPAAATLAGSGDLSATAGQVAGATLAGTGALSAAGQQRHTTVATLAGSGDLSAAARAQNRATATLAGGGDLSAAAVRVQPAAVTLAGGGDLSASATRVQPATTVLAGTGGLAAAGTREHAAAVVLGGAGWLSAEATRIRPATTVLAGSGALSAAGQATYRAGAVLDGAGALSGSATRVQPAGTALAGEGALAASGTRVRPASVVLPGGGDLTAAGRAVRRAAAILDGGGQLIAQAQASAGGTLSPLVWAVGPGGVLTALPHVVKLAISPQASAVGSVELEYPAYGLRSSTLRGILDRQGVLEIETWLHGRREQPRRWFLTDVTGDSTDERAISSYKGGSLELLCEWVILGPSGDAKNPETAFSGASAGTMVRTVVQRIQGRGGLAGVTMDFTASADSTGTAWPTTAKVSFSPEATLADMLGELIELGLIDGWEITAGRILRLYGPGRMGMDRTLGARPTTFRRGQNISSAPRSYSARKVGTALWTQGAEGLSRWDSDASAEARMGMRIERATSAQNVSDVTTLAGYGQGYLRTIVGSEDEVAHSLPLGAGHPRPQVGYDCGDKVLSDTDGVLRTLIVQQWSLVWEGGRPRGELVLGTLRQAAILTLLRRLKRVSSGAEVIGTSKPPADPDTLAPSAPTGVTVSSLAGKNDDGTTEASLLVGWAHDGKNSDGSDATDRAGYRVEYRYRSSSADAWQLGRDVLDGTATSTSVGNVAAGVRVQVRVLAYDHDGNVSVPSAVVELVTETDTTAPPAPSTPAVSGRLGVITARWDGLSSTGGAMPLDFDYLEVHMSTSSGFTPVAPTSSGTGSTYRGRIGGPGPFAIADLIYGTSYYFRFVAVDTDKNRSTPSAVSAAISPSPAVESDVFDGAVGTSKLKDLVVVNAKMANLAVNDAKMANVGAGKILAGIVSADLSLAGSIIAGDPAAGHTEQDSGGIRVYNPSNVQVVQFGTNGRNWMAGEFRTALSGSRLVLNPMGTDPDTMLFYPTGAGTRAKIASSTAPSDGSAAIIISGGAGSNGRFGLLGAYASEAALAFASGENGFSRTAVSVNNNNVNIWSPLGGAGDFRLYRTSGSNTTPLGQTEVRIGTIGGTGGDCPLIFAPGQGGGGIKFDNADGVGVVLMMDNFNRYIDAKANQFINVSTQDEKENITHIRSVMGSPLAQLRATPTYAFKQRAEIDHPDREAAWHFGPLAEQLPDELVVWSPKADGSGLERGVALGDQIGWLRGVVEQLDQEELRYVHGSKALGLDGSLTWRAGIHDVAILWEQAPLDRVRGADARLDVGVVWQGRMSARVLQDTVTDQGCTVQVTVTAPVVLTAAQPLTVHATAIYRYSPPWTPPAAA